MVLGSQWGDEGKGKLVDVLAQQYDIVARAQACTVSLSQRHVVARYVHSRRTRLFAIICMLFERLL